MIKKGIKALIAEAEAEIETLGAEEAVKLLDDPEVTFIDLRDIRELWRDGTIPGSVHAPRGMLEFWVDPESPYHREVFTNGNRLVLFCAAGWRSALATQTLRRMGLERVAHIGGGYAAWQEVGGPTVAKEQREAQ